MDFQETLAAARAGAPAAIEQLFERWRPLLRLQAARRLGAGLAGRVDPSDVVQETLAQAASELGSFQGEHENQWVAWLGRLLAGHAAKSRRFHRAQKRDPGREVTFSETTSRSSEPTNTRKR